MLPAKNIAIENPSASSTSDDCGGRPRFSVGTLVYSKAGLAALFMWLLWGDFCFTMIETVMPSIVPGRSLAVTKITFRQLLTTFHPYGVYEI